MSDLVTDAHPCLHHYFEVQAERTPEAIAVIAGNERLSYHELDRRARRLAVSLRKYGVGAEVPVGIFSERSVSMVVGMLAVLKAGGAYLPLDPAYPEARLRFILEDVEPPVILTSTRLRERLPTATATRLLCLDAAGDAVASPRPPGSCRSQRPGSPTAGADRCPRRSRAGPRAARSARR